MTHHKGVDESEFYMWRAVFSFSVADHRLSDEKRRLLKACLVEVAFSKQQLELFRADFEQPQNVVTLYEKITAPEHRQKFCALARALVWCDGDLDRQEDIILKHLPCLGGGEGAELLFRSRHRSHAEACSHLYEKAGMAGFFKVPPSVEVRV